MKKSVHSPAQIHLQTRLKEARLASGQTQATVAERLGKPQSFVAKYEAGERRLDAIELIQVARVVGLEPSSFIAELQSFISKV
ncbi:MAG: helix-turn-helix domain-containing protein [Beijerinckiaceae bacterium]